MGEFDWVTARAECSTALMFAKLKAAIKSDIETRNKQKHKEDAYSFVCDDEDPSVLYVMRQSRSACATVKFTLSNDRIIIAGDSGNALTATITLNDDGECKFKLEGTECESWKLRKKALEDLFFNF